MRYFIYALRRLTDPKDPLLPAELWAKRRRKVLTSIIIDYSVRQRRRARLLSTMKLGDCLIVPSFHSLSSNIEDALKLLQALQDRGIRVVLVSEQLEIRPGSVRLRILADFGRLLQSLAQVNKREARVKASYLARLFGTKIGRDPLPMEHRREVLRLIHEEKHSLAEAAKRVGISKSSAHRISKRATAS